MNFAIRGHKISLLQVDPSRENDQEILRLQRIFDPTDYQGKIRNLEILANETGRARKAQKFVKNANVQRQCPQNDCRGYLEDWKCALCSTAVCKKCHVITSQEHECNVDDIETAKLFATNMKLCPNTACRAPIFKISGCPQMFCVSCSIFFDWNTMEIAKSGARHNPHYFEWLAKNPGKHLPTDPEPANMNACGDDLNSFVIRGRLSDQAAAQVRQINHILAIVRPKFAFVGDDDDILTDMRIKYLLKEISEKDWKTRLDQIEKKNLVHTEIYAIIETLRSGASSLFEFHKKASSNLIWTYHEKLNVDMDELRVYINKCLVDLNAWLPFNGLFSISPDWRNVERVVKNPKNPKNGADAATLPI
jgi:hypothetical protein